MARSAYEFARGDWRAIAGTGGQHRAVIAGGEPSRAYGPARKLGRLRVRVIHAQRHGQKPVQGLAGEGQPARRGWEPATLDLGGMTPIAVGGGGGVVNGGPVTFAFAASGRVPPAAIGLDAAVSIFG